MREARRFEDAEQLAGLNAQGFSLPTIHIA